MVRAFVYAGYIIIKGEYLLKLRFFLILSDCIVVTAKEEPDFTEQYVVFKDVIGQEDVKQLLIHSAKNGKMPHAVLLTGPAGSGKLPVALAVARYLLCHHPAENDACGQCNSCKMMDHLAHPDMHFAFPVVRKKAGRDVVCDEFLPQWREMLGRNPYADLQEWMRVIDAGNQQPQIYVRESDEIQRKLSLKASQGGYKVMLIWLPEKMNVECANKLLKLLEEPPLKTVFLLVSEEPDLLLPTIVSRTQRINLKPLPESDIERYLVERYMLPVEDARDIAHRSAGSLLRAVEMCIWERKTSFVLNSL